MPRPKLTEEEIGAMREVILKGAFEILQEEGPEGLSIRAIAERVGVSHMVLYSYFENRDEIFTALRNYARLHHLARHQEALARAQEGEIMKVLREILEGYVRFSRERPHAFLFIWGGGRRWGGYPHRMGPPHEMPGKEQHSHAPHPSPISEELTFLERLIEMGIEQGAFVERDPPTAALMVTSMIIGPLMIGQMSGLSGPENRRKLECEAIETTMRYLTGKEQER
jgi:AcrR family transcriptional regulator